MFVAVRPTLFSFPSDKRVNRSQSVVMFCDADGVPKPTITWLYNVSASFMWGSMYVRFLFPNTVSTFSFEYYSQGLF